MTAYECVEALILYAENNLLMDELDETYKRNKLYEFLGLSAKVPVLTADAENAAEAEYPDDLLDELCAALKVTDGEKLKDGVCDILSLSPHEVADEFDVLYKISPVKATDFLYDYSVKNGYVKLNKIKQNPTGGEKLKGGEVRYAINLTRKEFDNKGENPVYPKCNICLENEGCADKLRRSLRTIPLTLNGEEWFWQYSPYGYFNEHGIAVCREHRPMAVDVKAVKRLLEFVDKFPHYFIGSNAALEGVGGSILAHDHYQGGREKLPLQNAPAHSVVSVTDNLKIEVVDYYVSALRLTSKDKNQIYSTFKKLDNAWSAYNNDKLGIVANDGARHNALSPIARKENGEYILDIIFKNNRADEAHPLGIFHVPQKYQCIKKEAIGLIEAQGLFVLPGRLNKELPALAKALASGDKLPEELKPFAEFATEIGAVKSESDALEKIYKRLPEVLAEILKATAPLDKATLAAFASAAISM